MVKNRLKIIEFDKNKNSSAIKMFFNREIVISKALEAANKIVKDIKINGDNALLQAISKYDNVNVNLKKIKVSDQEIQSAINSVDKSFVKAVNYARKNIVKFSKASLKKNWREKTKNGGYVGELFIPIKRVGCYIPGGAAPLVSTSLMTVILAKIAGVEEIVACSPPSADGSLNPNIIYALHNSGATEIYKMGGAHAIASMAYGTKTIKKVNKIVGPGGPYVTAAKKIVYGDVAIDMVAGPSEIGILTDSTANPKFVAADLLSQAEHGTSLEKALLITTSMKQAQLVKEQVLKQSIQLKRRKIITDVINNGMMIVVVKNLNDGVDLINDFAPEHMELIVKNPKKIIPRIKTAGALFIGSWTPECVGDFIAGPSHVLPTGGTCKYFSGLTVDDFRRRMSVVEYKEDDLKDSLEAIEIFGNIETLDAHSKSATIRFRKEV
ncbi:MAG: histidinol dehydrogenase [Verrucomicrobiota bacterium]|nr:histidinol dehydrogenase [Verrucomicrobiota bacterium]